MASPKAELHAYLYRKAVNATIKTVEAIPADKRFKQAVEGKAHPTWLLGHLAMSLDMLTNSWTLGLDMTIPPDWGRTFGPHEFGGAPITTNPDDYPAWDDILAAYKKAGDNAVEKIKTLTDDDLDKFALGPMPEQFQKQFGKLEKSLPDNAFHDHHHRGQMTIIVALP